MFTEGQKVLVIVNDERFNARFIKQDEVGFWVQRQYYRGDNDYDYKIAFVPFIALIIAN